MKLLTYIKTVPFFWPTLYSVVQKNGYPMLKLGIRFFGPPCMLLGCRLRELLDSDKCQYASESSATTHETALERQSRLRERARQLREKREQERLAYVEEKYKQQFRWVRT